WVGECMVPVVAIRARDLAVARQERVVEQSFAEAYSLSIHRLVEGQRLDGLIGRGRERLELARLGRGRRSAATCKHHADGERAEPRARLRGFSASRSQGRTSLVRWSSKRKWAFVHGAVRHRLAQRPWAFCPGRSVHAFQLRGLML